MNSQRKQLGNLGERLAEQLLQKKKHRILKRNLKTNVGEIDLLTRDRETIVLVEVKTKRGRLFGLPQDMVHHHKQYKLRQLARWLEQQYPGAPLRIDVVAVDMASNPPTLEHIESAVEAC